MALGPLRLLPPGKGGSCPLEAQQILKSITSAHRAWTLGGGSLGGDVGLQVCIAAGEWGGVGGHRLGLNFSGNFLVVTSEDVGAAGAFPLGVLGAHWARWELKHQTGWERC